jgi:hypothetical protein
MRCENHQESTLSVAVMHAQARALELPPSSPSIRVLGFRPMSSTPRGFNWLRDLLSLGLSWRAGGAEKVKPEISLFLS